MRLYLKNRSKTPFFIPLLLCFLVCAFTFAAPKAYAAKAYVDAGYTGRPVWGNSSFYLNFTPNESICRDKYGSEWEQKCDAWLGKAGSEPKGIKGIVWPEGQWQWGSSDQLVFTPSTPWKSGTKYVVDVSSLVIPPTVEVSNKTITFEALPRSVSIDSTKVWIDPSGKAEHALSFGMRFTESLSPEIRAQVEAQSSIVGINSPKLKLSKGEWIWLDDNSRAVVNSRILALPKEKSTVKLTLPKIRPIWLDKKDNTWYFPNEDATEEIIIPGINSLFTLKKSSLEQWQNKSLQMETHLVFRFSQRASGEELLKALTVYELPKKRSTENVIPTNWTDGNIGKEALKGARKITPKFVQIPDQDEDFIRYSLDITPDSYIYWSIAEGFGPTNIQGIKKPLERSLQGVMHVAKDKAVVKFLQQGNILNLESNIALITENVDSIQWKAYRIQDTKLAQSFHRMDFEPDQSTLDSMSTIKEGKVAIDLKKRQASYASQPNFTTLLTKDVFAANQDTVAPGLVYLKVRGYKDGRLVKENGRLLMYSNMSMVVKELPNDSRQVYVCYMPTAKGLSGVTVQVLGANGLPVAEAKTDEQGLATLPNLSNFKNEKSPSAIVIRRSSWNDDAEDFLWMSLKDYNRRVYLSSSIEKEGKQRSANTLNAFVFAERGIFRPGDVLNFGALLRTNDWSLLPKNMPLVAEIHDSKSRKVFEKAFIAGEGIHSFTWEIPETALTGSYQLYISTAKTANTTGFSLGVRSVKVENFLPDTLRIKTDLVNTAQTSPQGKAIPTKGWLVASETPGSTALRVQLDTLFGQVAVGRKVTSSMTLAPAQLHFTDFKGYTFQDVSPFFSKDDDPIKRALKPSTTDGKGQALIPLDFTQWRFGTLSCTIETEGFEPDGGRSVSQEQNFLLSPLTFMLGFKSGEGADNKDFIMKNSSAKMHFQAVNPQLQIANPGSLTFSISRRSTVTSLVTDSRGQYTFETTPVETEVSQSEQTLDAQGALAWNLPTQEVGDYVLNVKVNKNTKQDANGKILTQGTILARVPFSIVGDDDLRPALTSLYNMPVAKLHLKTDKEDYNGGDVAKLMITAPYDGVALLTLERDKVATHKWVKVAQGSNMHEMAIPENFMGRGYIQVLMGRAPQSDNIFLQGQSVAVASISVNTAQRTANLAIKAPEKAVPGSPLRWRIENPQGKPVKAVLFAVDEGILQLSRYATPNPLHYLLLDRALEVNTYQLFDRIMPQDKKIMQRLSAFGGGDYEGEKALALLGTFQNPFKRKQEAPVRWWSGVVDVPAGGLDMEIPIPNYYNGNIRLMAVVHADTAVGHSESNVIVQAQQVITPQMPAMASLGDSFEAGLAIANTTDAPVTLTLTHGFDAKSGTKSLSITGLPQSITLQAKEEKLLPYQVRVGQEPGDATLLFTIEDGKGGRIERSASISIRPAVLPRFSKQTLLLSQATNVHVPRKLLPYNAQTSLTLSPVPLPLLQASLSYLQNYPFSCVEQSLSKAFPLAVMANTPLSKDLEKNVSMLSPKQKESVFANANNALISAFQNYRGVSIWPDNGPRPLMLTAYAADYVLALRDAHMPIPSELLPGIFNTLEEMSDKSPNTIEEFRSFAYATWVLARAGYVVSRQLELCETFIRENDFPQGDIYNSFMAGAYAALYMHAEAQKHLKVLTKNVIEQWAGSGGSIGELGMLEDLGMYGMHARVLAKHFPEKFQEILPILLEQYMAGLNKNHSTADAAMMALALVDILKSSPEQSMALNNVQAVCDKYSTSNAPQAQSDIFPNFYTLSAPQCEMFHVGVPKGQKMYAQIQSYGYDATLPTKAIDDNIRVQRMLTFTDGTPFQGTINQGQVLRVDVKTHLLQQGSAQVVVVDLIPGGFELVLDHEGDTGTSYEMNLFRGEDRIIASFDTSSEGTTVTYHIRAITKGTYTLPVAQAEGLYDTSLQSRTPAGKVTIVAP